MKEERTDNPQRSESTSQANRVTAGERGVAVDGGAMQSPIVTGDRNVVITIYQDAQVRIPSPEAIEQHRVELRRRLEAEARQRWGGMGAYIHEEGAHLPIEASPYQPGGAGLRMDMLECLRQANHLIVLGEPGAGKTVALQRFAWELCGESSASVPVLIPLLYYAGTPLEVWVRALLQETSRLRLDDNQALDAFLKEGKSRFYFLFDGLNEVALAYRAQLRDELVRWMASYSRHVTIITSRTHDEQWRTLRQRVSQVLLIQPITELQTQTYFITQLGQTRGQELFNRLDTRLRALAQRPLLLWFMKEAAAANEPLPGNRGELYQRFVTRMLKRDTERELHVQIPARVKHQAAACLADGLQHRHALVCPQDEAVDIVARANQFGRRLAEESIEALARHGLLIGDEHVRFPHQTIQEYFAAEALRYQVRHEQELNALQRLQRSLRATATGRSEGLVAFAMDDWWAESLIQLAGLVDDPAWLARTIARVNPWLAWWGIEEGRGVDQETRTQIENRSINLLKSKRPEDRRRALQILSQMRSERAIDTLFQFAADSDPDLAVLALPTLLNMGREAREHALVLAQRPRSPGYEGSLAYLSALLDCPVVFVPPGSFEMGGNPSLDRLTDPTEQPAHQVTVSGFWIGRYPVTVAQFLAFVENSNYKPSHPDTLKGEDTHPVTNVSWHDAMAYCRWLSESTGLTVTLPNEAEWEKAARGTEGHIYPWGNDPPEEMICNFGHDSMTRGTTPVGKYSPRGDSPSGCADMAGNVWEWTRSIHRSYPYNPDDGREDVNAEGPRVLRGGAFHNNSKFVRCTARLKSVPNVCQSDRGFRIIVHPL